MSRVTYTGRIGPGVTLTSKVFNDVKNFSMDFVKRVLTITYMLNNEQLTTELDISGASMTLTDTITANDHVIAISVTP